MMTAKEAYELTNETGYYTHLRAHEPVQDHVCRLLLEKKKYHLLRYDKYFSVFQ